MPTYYVEFSGSFVIEADSYEEAKENARLRVPVEADEWNIEEEEDL